MYLEQFTQAYLISHFLICKTRIILWELTPTKMIFSRVVEINEHILIIIMMPKDTQREEAAVSMAQTAIEAAVRLRQVCSNPFGSQRI